jgi:hypothetical protein
MVSAADPLLKANRRFGRTYRLNFEERRVNQSRDQHQETIIDPSSLNINKSCRAVRQKDHRLNIQLQENFKSSYMNSPMSAICTFCNINFCTWERPTVYKSALRSSALCQNVKRK